jgi:hypothetical protein
LISVGTSANSKEVPVLAPGRPNWAWLPPAVVGSGCPKGNTASSRGCKPTEKKPRKNVPALEGPDNTTGTER